MGRAPGRVRGGRLTGRGRRRGGAMATAAKLAGVGGFLSSVHQNAKGKHQRDEELTANVPRGLARAESVQRRRGARGGGEKRR